MKQFNLRQLFLTAILLPACQLVVAQCVAPTVTASGPTALCTGNSVTLSAPSGNTWVQKANTGGSLKIGAVGFSIGNKGYIGTGTDNPTGSATKKDFWEYDPATNVWTQKADFGGAARSNATGFSIGTKGYIGTGTITPEGMNLPKVYPVPATDVVWVNGNTPGLIGKQMQLAAMDGSVLQTIRIGQWPQRIDISALPAGIYLLRLPDRTTMKVIRR